VIYLLFTIGHTAPTGDALIRRETVGEALRLAHLLNELVPERRDVAGLLALLLVNDARRDSRVSEDGRARRISDQDRSTWDQAAILKAQQLIAAHVRMGPADRYTLQAEIAIEHAKAPTYEDVDWREIVRLYDELVIVWPSPVVQLNRAVALSKTSGAELALQIVDRLETDGRLHQYQYLPAVKAYLLDQLGRSDEAEVARSRAFELAANEVERDFLMSQFR
jgi:RNA polymerase sigma-70 factor (ECF subfamily)